ncbi:RxLR effector protein [Phytophthora megakarya]|uniref:RxLR effector protein n=1 Tax=Phytophthora megakarya TaxID=4795 RepID=A0A225WKM3_9STRA|nr:RxLR effector protein [Phytophthora megakarya]
MEFLLNPKWHDNGCIIDEKGKPLSFSDYPALRSTRLRELLGIPEKTKTASGEYAVAIQVRQHAGKDLHANIRQITKWCRTLIISLPWTTWNAPTTTTDTELCTDYQNWTIYRVALGRLNLFHEGWPEKRNCPENNRACIKESVEHIIWQCSKAKTSWKGWMDKWLGHSTSQVERHNLLQAVATRTAPKSTIAFMAKAQQCTTR